MKAKYFESSITIKINFPDEGDVDDIRAEFSQFTETKAQIRKTLKQFGFDMIGYDSSDYEHYDCFSKDNLEDLIVQRTKFVIKALKTEKTVEVLDFKIKSVLIDSTINDDFSFLKAI